MKRLIQPQHADNWRAGGPGCLAVFCIAALLAAISVGCGGSASSGTLAYVSNATGNGFKVFKVNSNGTLTPASISPLNTTASPRILQITPDEKWAYFLDAGRQHIYGFRRAGNGSFSSAVDGSPFPLSGSGSALAVNNQFVYVALPNALGGELEIFQIDQSTGTLSHSGGGLLPPLGYSISQLLMSPDGALLYGLAPAQQTVVTFTNVLNGQPTGPTTTTVGLTPPCFGDPLPVAAPCGGMILSANGSFLYVVDEIQTGNYPNVATGIDGQSPNIYGFTTSGTGILSPMADSPFHENADLVTQLFPTGPVAGATSRDSRFLFIANQGSHNISVFRIATSTGELTEVTGSLSGGVSTASPFDCGAGCSTPTFVAVSKNNNAVYALDPSPAVHSIFQFAVDQNNGRLRPLNPASVDAGATPVWITVR